MLYALGQPASLLGLLLGFLLALAVRALAIRGMTRALRLDRWAGGRGGFNLRRDVDPFGAVGAAVGLGWGRPLDATEVPRHRGRGAAALVFAAGPLAAIALGEALLGVTVLVYGTGSMLLEVLPPTAMMLGVARDSFGPADVPLGEQVLLSLAVAPICFGVLALLPMPPLDGFGLLWSCFRAPGPGLQKYRHWFADNNIGIAVLLAVMLIPFLGTPFFLVIDAVAAPLMRVWT